MAQVIWTEPAVADFDAIADYIALENPDAATNLVKRVLAHVRQLADHLDSGSRIRELARLTRYRQIIEPPCRIFYRHDGKLVIVLHVMRTERLLRQSRLGRAKSTK